MKATINGTSVEGTPEEIMQFKELMNRKAKPLIPHDPPDFRGWWGLYPPNRTGSTGVTPEWMKTITTSSNSEVK